MSEATDLIGERRAVMSGAAQSDVGRRLGRDPLELTIDACLAAIEDAGLTTADIDGIATYPGGMDSPPGFSGAGTCCASARCGRRRPPRWVSTRAVACACRVR